MRAAPKEKAHGCSERSGARFGFVRARARAGGARGLGIVPHLERARARSRTRRYACSTRCSCQVKSSQVYTLTTDNGFGCSLYPWIPKSGTQPNESSFFLGQLAARFNLAFCKSKPTMREVISIHLGQCGVQIGNACWELYCLVRLRALEPNRTHRARPSCEPALACPIRARYSLSQRERCARHPTATRTRIGAASSACLAHHPIPPCPANAPARDDLLSVSPLLHPLSHVSSPYVPCPAGARHPARRPDALGQDDRRR